MSFLIRLFRQVWAVYAIVFFGVSIVFYLPTLMLIITFSGSKRFQNGLSFVKFWSKTLLVFFGMPWKIRGKEHINPDKTYVIVSNHVSQIDILACLVTIPIDFKFLAKKETEKIPAVGYCVKNLHLLVDRKNKTSRLESMRLMTQCIQSGVSVMIYPEGTRNKGPKLLKSFYDGAFRLAVKTQSPILVYTLQNTWNRQSAHMGFQLQPGLIKGKFEDSISTEGLNEMDIPMLKEKTIAILEKNLKEVQGEQYINP